jgi:transposase
MSTRRHWNAFSTCWRGDDPGSLRRSGVAGGGRTDMRKGMNGLALQLQQVLGRDPHAGDLYVF